MSTAEAAVIDGIGCCEDLSPRGLLIETVRFAVRRGTITANAPSKSGAFPLNFKPSSCCSRYRDTALFFKFWWASPPAVCAQLLDISTPDFESALDAAFIDVLLCSPND